MNFDMFGGIFRSFITAAVGYVAGKGILPAGVANEIGAAVIAIGSAWWSASTHTNTAKMAAPGTIPGVSKVEISGTPEVKALANSGATGSKVQAKAAG